MAGITGSPRGHPFKEQLQVAYKQQLIANQANVSNFVNTIAALCDSYNEQLDGRAIASALRGIERGELGPSVAPTMFAPASKSPRRPPGGALRNTALTNGASVNGGAGIPDDVIKDSAIKRLPFIEDDGSIDKPTPSLQRALGPKYIAFVELCHSLLSGWAPMPGIACIVKTKLFDLMSASVIIANFFYIAVQSDYRVAHLREDEPFYMVAIGYTFTVWYTFELICNMTASGKHFLIGPDYGWNLFDFAIVAVSLLEIMIQLAGGDSGNMSFLKIVRFMRISRVLRMFSAMRMFKEIKIMVDSLAGSMGIFFFCSIMLALFLSLFAVFFVQGVSSYLETEPDIDEGVRDDMLTQFGQVTNAMLALFVCATGGDDWRQYHDIVKVLGPQYDFLFLLFVDFYVFAFVNVVVGVFCEKAVSLAAPTTNELMSKRYEKEFRDANALFDLLDRHMAHEGDTNSLTADKFEQFIADPEVEKYFEVRGLKTSSATRFFKLLCDLHQTDKIDYATFVSAIVLLDGQASCIDLHVISVRQLHGLHLMQASMEAHHQEFQKLLGGVPQQGDNAMFKRLPENGDLHLGKLSSIEQEIKELKLIAGSPAASREASRTAADIHIIGNGVAEILMDTEEHCRAQAPPSQRLPKNAASEVPNSFTEARIEALQAAHNAVSSEKAALERNVEQLKMQLQHVQAEHQQSSEALAKSGMDLQASKHSSSSNNASLEEKVKFLERKLEHSNASHQGSSEAAAKSGTELQTAKLKTEQLQRLIKLQDSREAEVRQQFVQMKSGYEGAMASRDDWKDQVSRLEGRIAELNQHIGKLTDAQTRAAPRAGYMNFDTCGTPRTKDDSRELMTPQQ